jgi:hypothetical protein
VCRRPLLLFILALAGWLGWPAPAHAAGGALVMESSTVAIPGSQFRIDFTLSRGRYYGDSSPQLSFEISRGESDAAQLSGEIHMLQFELPPWALTTANGNRKAKLHAEGWLGRWGSMDMSFAASGAAISTSKDVGSCPSVPARVLSGKLKGKLTLKLPGIGDVHLTSIPVTVTDYPSLPSGCFSQTGPSCASGNATASDGSQLLAELQLDTFHAGPQPAGPEVTEFYVDASASSGGNSGLPPNVAVVGFLDSPQTTRPALVIHYLLLETTSPSLVVDSAAKSATLTASGPMASGTLSFLPTQGVAAGDCGDLTLVAGRVTGSLTVNFTWGGVRRFSGDSPATLTLGPTPSAPATPAAPAATATRSIPPDR